MQSHIKPLAYFLPLVCSLNTQAQNNLDTIIVTANRQETRVSELLADATVIDQAEIERNGQGSVADLLARQPGIQVSSNGGPGTTTSFYIRGARPEQTLVLVDGLPLNSVDLSGSPLRFLPLANIERIEILRGPASTLYGADAMGGVIQIFTKRGEAGLKGDAFVGYGSRNTAQASAGIAGGNEHWRFRLEGNHASSDSISAQTGASNRDADTDAYRNDGGAASVSFLPTKGHEIGAIYRRNEGLTHYDSGDVPANGNFNNRVAFVTEQWQLFAKNRFTDHWTSTLRYGQTNDWQKNYSQWSPQGELLETENRLLSWQHDIVLPLGQALLGAEYLEQEALPRSSYAADNQVDTTSVLAGWKANWRDHRWQINGRHDAHSQFGDKNTYSLAYGYQLSKSLRAHASYGTAFKAPSLYQLYVPFYGNANLQPEDARNREAGLVWESGRHMLSATYYLNKVANLIDFSMATWTYQNVSAARLEGVTLAYSGQFDDWFLSTSYDWLDATNEDTSRQLGRRARNKAQVNLGKKWGAFQTGAEWQFVGSRFNTNEETGRMGGYSLVNLTGRYAINSQLAIEARINNLFDKRYATTLDYMNSAPFGTFGLNAFIGIRYTSK